MQIKNLRKLFLGLGLIACLVLVMAIVMAEPPIWQPVAVIAAVFIAIGFGAVSVLKSYQYTAWIIAAIVAGLVYPSAFLEWGDFDLRNEWVILFVVQAVMFGMGTQMSLKDFAGLKTTAKGVLVGLICQFTIMPLVGFMLTLIFDFEPEIAAGIILIGSCSSGLASNVMVYIARADLTLSVTLTAIATLFAPLMTPLLMKILAGTYVEVNFFDMFLQVIKIVIVPIGAALLVDAYKNGPQRFHKYIMSGFWVALAWLILIAGGLWGVLDAAFPAVAMKVVEVLSFLCGAIVFGVLYYHVTRYMPKINGFMPYISMFGIVYFTVVTTAASHENILAIGLFMLLASIMHNTLGYLFGYNISRALKLGKNSARTIALEVGLQNGGMASGLAGVMGKLATLGLAAAVFSPWMNISGSMLANYWRRRKIQEGADKEEGE